jgi:hypothetical protein
MRYIRDRLHDPNPRQAKVILLSDSIVVTATAGGTDMFRADVAPDHKILPLHVDSESLYSAVADMLAKHQASIQVPGPSYAEKYAWLKKPDIVADVDVVEYEGAVELRYPVYPLQDSARSFALYARESFHKDRHADDMTAMIMKMLEARRNLLTLTGAPKQRAFDGSSDVREKMDWRQPMDPRKL